MLLKRMSRKKHCQASMQLKNKKVNSPGDLANKSDEVQPSEGKQVPVKITETNDKLDEATREKQVDSEAVSQTVSSVEGSAEKETTKPPPKDISETATIETQPSDLNQEETQERDNPTKETQGSDNPRELQESDNSKTENPSQPVKRKRGRPRKAPLPEQNTTNTSPNLSQKPPEKIPLKSKKQRPRQPPKKRGPGRPKKLILTVSKPPKKRKRGRPRKRPPTPSSTSESSGESSSSDGENSSEENSSDSSSESDSF